MSKKQKGVPTPKGVNPDDYMPGHFKQPQEASLGTKDKLDNILNIDQGKDKPDLKDQATDFKAPKINIKEANELDGDNASEVEEADEDNAIDELQLQCEKYKDQALRASAEMENIRRRSRVDIEKAHKYGQEKLITALLPVIDNLEQATAAVDQHNEDLKPILEGLELNHKLFIDALSKFNVEAIDPQDVVFDAQEHEALSMTPSAEVPANNILSVVQKGYKLAGRVIRPAKVIVSKGQDDQ
jgi:molecular chaperone GrpE